jgi:hypothetical protein
MADGVDEIEVVNVMSHLRDAGLCVKSLGVAGGLVEGKHGIMILPDATLVDFRHVIEPAIFDLLVLPGDQRHVQRLRHDPRIYDLVQQVVTSGGLVAMRKGTHYLAKDALGCEVFLERRAQVLIWDPLAQPLTAFALDLVRRLEPISRLS